MDEDQWWANDAPATVADARKIFPAKTVGGAVGTNQQLGNAAQKLASLRVLRSQLGAVEREFRDIEGPRKVSSGLVGGLLPTREGREFDATVNQLSPLIRQLTRVPGEGAQSDYEARLAQATLPSRRDYNSVTRKQIEGLRRLIDEYEAALGVFAGRAPVNPAARPVQPQAQIPARPPVRRPAPAAGKIIDFNDLPE